MHIPGVHQKKLDSKARVGVFVEYGENVKGFRIWYLATNKVEYARDVIFDERKSNMCVDKVIQSSETEEEIKLERHKIF